jgi:hypothetical protein
MAKLAPDDRKFVVYLKTYFMKNLKERLIRNGEQLKNGPSTNGNPSGGGRGNNPPGGGKGK